MKIDNGKFTFAPVLVIFLVIMAVESYGQLEAKAGINIHRVRRGYPALGVGYNFNLYKKFSVRPELFRGIGNTSQPAWDIPVVVNYQISDLIGIHAGPHVSLGCHCPQDAEDVKTPNYFSVGTTLTFGNGIVITSRYMDGEILQLTAGYLFRKRK